MKKLLIGILFFASVSVGNANTATDYLLSEGQVMVVKYTGCNGEEMWAMNGTPQNWLAAERGTPANYPVWVIALSEEEVEEVREQWFKPYPVIRFETTVPKEWCEAQ